MSTAVVDDIARRILHRLRTGADAAGSAGHGIPVGVSNRHVHLCRKHIDQLFGPGHELTVFRDLSQTGEFAAREKLSIIGPGGVLENVRVLGPERDQTQIEISRADSHRLGFEVPVRLSGRLNGERRTPGVTLAGPAGIAVTDSGLIIAARHVHADPEDARRLGIADGAPIRLRAPGSRPVVFEDVAVRVRPGFKLEFHIDMDEANAALLRNGDLVEIARN